MVIFSYSRILLTSGRGAYGQKVKGRDDFAASFCLLPVDASNVLAYNVASGLSDQDGYTGLGTGWGFNFTHIETTQNNRAKRLVLSTGQTFTLDNSSTGIMAEYALGDIRVVQSSQPDSDNSESYVVYYADGKTESLDGDGRLRFIRDRFGNTISFTYPVIGEKSAIQIVDTLGRMITISSEDTETGILVRLDLPENQQITHTLTHKTNLDLNQKYSMLGGTFTSIPAYNVSGFPNERGEYVLTSVTDLDGITTTYDYADKESKFNLYGDLSESCAGTNYTAALTKVTHQTGLSTNYEYFNHYIIDYTSFGRQSNVAMLRRYELDGATKKNDETYCYSRLSGYSDLAQPDAVIDAKL